MKRNQSEPLADGTWPVDLMLLGIASFLLVYGLVMVGSASLEVSAKTYANAFHLLNRHIVYLCISLGIAAVALSIPIFFWQRFDGLRPKLASEEETLGIHNQLRTLMSANYLFLACHKLGGTYLAYMAGKM